MITGVEDGAVYDLADGVPKATWTTSATATLDGEPFAKNGEITDVGAHTLIVTNDNVVITINFTVVDSAFVLGDMDGDGEISVADALSALRIAIKLVEGTQESFRKGDIDADGEITVSDALRILRIAAGIA